MGMLAAIFDSDKYLPSQRLRFYQWLPVNKEQDKLFVKRSCFSNGHYWFLSAYLPYESKQWNYTLFLNRKVVEKGIQSLQEVESVIRKHELAYQKERIDLSKGVNPVVMVKTLRLDLNNAFENIEIQEIPGDLYKQWALWQFNQQK